MRVEFLGTSGFHPTESRHTSCVLLPEIGLALDAGTGMFRLPKRLGTPGLTILLSHAHLDHICGLTYLLPPVFNGEISPVKVIANARTRAAVEDHLFHEAVFPIRIPFEFAEPADGMDLPGGGRLSFRTQVHPGTSLGYRIDWPGHSLAYLTDTIADREALQLIRGVDLLIHECNFRDDNTVLADRSGHAHTTPVCELARDSDVKQLILTHFDPYAALADPVDIQLARSIFPETAAAEDLLIVEF